MADAHGKGSFKDSLFDSGADASKPPAKFSAGHASPAGHLGSQGGMEGLKPILIRNHTFCIPLSTLSNHFHATGSSRQPE